MNRFVGLIAGKPAKGEFFGTKVFQAPVRQFVGATLAGAGGRWWANLLVTHACDVLASTEHYAADRCQSRAFGDGLELSGSDGLGAHGKR